VNTLWVTMKNPASSQMVGSREMFEAGAIPPAQETLASAQLERHDSGTSPLKTTRTSAMSITAM